MELKNTNAECPTCDGTRSCDILFERRCDWNDEGSGVCGTMGYYVLECKGCRTIFFQTEESCSEDWEPDGDVKPAIKTYPSIERVKRSNRFLNHLFLPFEKFESFLFSEIYKAINNDMHILAAMGIRSLIDRIAIRLTGKNENYTKNVQNLVDSGYASAKQKEILDAALELGHGAVHRGHVPTAYQVTCALDIAESMIEMFLINTEKAEDLSKTIPARPKK